MAVVSPGSLLRERRRAHGLSQARLAVRAGTSQAAISRIESDDVSPSFATLQSLLACLGEELEISAHRSRPEFNSEHLAGVLARPPAERLELALSWNRLAGQVAAAGRTARSR